MAGLPSEFPFREVFTDFLKEYRSRPTYWYVQTARTVTDLNAKSIEDVLQTIKDDFLDKDWNKDTQHELLQALIGREILDPYKPGGPPSEGSALTREWKKLLEVLGLMWVQPSKQIAIRDAGLKLMTSTDPRSVLEAQIAKIQYPNPSLSTSYGPKFKGLLPHLFLLQVLQRCSYYVDVEEYELFINLSQSHDDLDRIIRYILSWRDLEDSERQIVRELARRIKMKGASGQLRIKRVHQNSSYQRALYTYPAYLEQSLTDRHRQIVAIQPPQLNRLVAKELSGLKITSFDSMAEWFAYFGDPNQQPSWYTYLSLAIEKAKTTKEAEKLVEEHSKQVTSEQKQELIKKQDEKAIENLYAQNLHMLEEGLSLEGQQYSTAIGRIDLLCRDSTGRYVVVELKAEEATDAAFGQILRYMGWVHRNLKGGNKNVRGVIVARSFPERARYSRIGLEILTDDYENFIKFKAFSL